MRFHYYRIWPPVYLFFAKFCIFCENNKLSSVLCILSCCITCIAHSSTLMVYKTNLIVGVPSLTHIPIDILTPPLHLQPLIYMSAWEYIFLCHAPCVFRYNKEKFIRRKMYSLAIVFSKFKKNPWCVISIPISFIIIHDGIMHYRLPIKRIIS